MATSRPSSTSVREFVDLSLSLAQVACTFAHSADDPVLRVGACLLLLARAIHCDYRAGRCRGQRTASQRMLRGKFLSSSCSRVGQKVAVSYLCTLNSFGCGGDPRFPLHPQGSNRMHTDAHAGGLRITIALMANRSHKERPQAIAHWVSLCLPLALFLLLGQPLPTFQ